jgi:hypothetical protein
VNIGTGPVTAGQGGLNNSRKARLTCELVTNAYRNTVTDAYVPMGWEALLAYLDHFGLPSGSFDLAVDRDGEFHWLELNPNGQWGWLEENTGLEMSAAFADLLAQGER